MQREGCDVSFGSDFVAQIMGINLKKWSRPNLR